MPRTRRGDGRPDASPTSASPARLVAELEPLRHHGALRIDPGERPRPAVGDPDRTAAGREADGLVGRADRDGRRHDAALRIDARDRAAECVRHPNRPLPRRGRAGARADVDAAQYGVRRGAHPHQPAAVVTVQTPPSPQAIEEWRRPV